MANFMSWYLQINGTEYVKTVFYEALGKSVGDKMHKGANAWDLLKFFMEVQKLNLEQGRKIKFKLRKQAGSQMLLTQ